MKDTKENALFAENKDDMKPKPEYKLTAEFENDKTVNSGDMPEYQEPSYPDSDSNAEPDGEEIAADGKAAAEKTIEALKQEIDQLHIQINKLEELKKSQNRILSELGDFTAIFPEIPVEKIPEEVWESVKRGASLAASYALYEKRMAAEALRIARINAKNASKSPGAAGTDTKGEYFSPDDVRRMSRSEVHANYSKIKESMKKWMQR